MSKWGVAYSARVYNILRKPLEQSPQSVAKRVLDNNFSYEELMAQWVFSDEDFFSRMESESFVDPAEGHPVPPINELAQLIQMADLATTIPSMK